MVENCRAAGGVSWTVFAWVHCAFAWGRSWLGPDIDSNAAARHDLRISQRPVPRSMELPTVMIG